MGHIEDSCWKKGQETKPHIVANNCRSTCGHSYDILGAGMLWKLEEARI
jgi:hypothetical protein